MKREVENGDADEHTLGSSSEGGGGGMAVGVLERQLVDMANT